MKSKTKISLQLKKKTNPDLVATVIGAKRNVKWMKVSEILSSPRRNHLERNLDSISKVAKEGESVVVPGKVLSSGELDKKVKVIAFSFSKNAREKIAKSGGKAITILEEIKSNPEAKGVRIITREE